jgi:hypothetical protein
LVSVAIVYPWLDQKVLCALEARQARSTHSETGVVGFTNGLAITIAAAQILAFQRCDSVELFVDCAVDEREREKASCVCRRLVAAHSHSGACVCMHGHYTVLSQGPPDWQDYTCITVSSLGWYSDWAHALSQALFRKTRIVEETAQTIGPLPNYIDPSFQPTQKPSTRSCVRRKSCCHQFCRIRLDAAGL